MKNQAITELAAIIGMGAIAQLVASLLRLPSILILLITGLVAGPGLGLINPDALFGDLLFPLVSLSVAIILFEGGLGLRFSDIRETRGAVRALVIGGPAVGWILNSVAAYLILGSSAGLSLLIGALLVVTGPTVTIPLLGHVKPRRDVASVLRWESILTDPIGALLAVVVYETLAREREFLGLPALAFANVFGMVFLGCACGIVAAALIVTAVRARRIPERLEAPFTLAMVIVIFVFANRLLNESGLLAVTVMGIVLGNQKLVPVRHITEFKENLQILLLSVLFIVLAARIDISQMLTLGVWGLLFALALFPIRLLGVILLTRNSELDRRGKLFVAFLAPRGIVAAAVSSLLGHQLSALNYPQAELLAPVIFTVIMVTVVICAIGARPLARFLKLSGAENEITVTLGAHSWARALAQSLRAKGRETLLIDTNHFNVTQARTEGLNVVEGSIINTECKELLGYQNIGTYLALTSNNEINALGALTVLESSKEAHCYEVQTKTDNSGSRQSVEAFARIQPLFGGRPFAEIESLFAQGIELVDVAPEDRNKLIELEGAKKGLQFIYGIDLEGHLVFETPKEAQLVSLVHCVALPLSKNMVDY